MLLTVKVPDKPTAKRSPQWPAVRKAWLQKHPKCEVCDRTTKLEVHHIVPFHIRPEYELNEANFMTLCEHPAACCHYIVGHCAISWLKYDPDVVIHAPMIRQMRLNAKP